MQRTRPHPGLRQLRGRAAVAAVEPDLIAPRQLSKGPMAWSAAAVALETLPQLPVLSVVVGTNGSASAIERARTVLEAAFPQGRRFPGTVGEFEGDVLRPVVALESAVPLLVVAVVAIGTGFLAAHLFLTAQMQYSLQPPGVTYYLVVVAGIAASLGIIAASLGIIASTLPLLKRITGPETARNE